QQREGPPANRTLEGLTTTAQNRPGQRAQPTDILQVLVSKNRLHDVAERSRGGVPSRLGRRALRRLWRRGGNRLSQDFLKDPPTATDAVLAERVLNALCGRVFHAPFQKGTENIQHACHDSFSFCEVRVKSRSGRKDCLRVSPSLQAVCRKPLHV